MACGLVYEDLAPDGELVVAVAPSLRHPVHPTADAVLGPWD